jgi:isoquinoline 1-oxidoreductase beta subunit
MGYGSYVAGAAEISVTDGNKIKVHRIVASTDPGHVVNPAQIERQIAGSFVYGLSALFYGNCTVKNGAIEQTNFDTYNSMRIAEMPKVESVIVPPAASGAASASRQSASRPPPCSMPTSQRPENASARCR